MKWDFSFNTFSHTSPTHWITIYCLPQNTLTSNICKIQSKFWEWCNLWIRISKTYFPEILHNFWTAKYNWNNILLKQKIGTQNRLITSFLFWNACKWTNFYRHADQLEKPNNFKMAPCTDGITPLFGHCPTISMLMFLSFLCTVFQSWREGTY